MVWLGSAGGAAAQPFGNGSFETPVIDTPWLTLDVAQTIGPWTVTAGQVDITYNWWPAYDGRQSIDMSGYVAGSLCQSFTTTSATTYDVSFWMSRNGHTGLPSVSLDAIVTAIKSLTFTHNAPGTTYQTPNWEKHVFSFTATGGASELCFESLDPPVGSGPDGAAMLDDVTVTGLAPANTAAPSIPAGGAPGSAVACNPGSWTGAPALAYAWLRNGVQVASGPTYTLVAADGGQSLVCRVTASNAYGSSEADSNALTASWSAAVPAPEPGPTSQPPPAPSTGRTVNVASERGTVTVRLPDGTTLSVDAAAQIPTGSVVDTRKGAVRLSSRGAGGRIESGVFSAGLFRVTQTTGRRPVTELTLVETLSCPRAKRASAGAAKKRKRRLWGDATGTYRTRGRYGSAVNTGTKWLIEDRCDGTLFRVERGVIRARRNGARNTVRVAAGQRYLIRRSP
jgi:choice-of-anchor C domain-containing protein